MQKSCQSSWTLKVHLSVLPYLLYSLPFTLLFWKLQTHKCQELNPLFCNSNFFLDLLFILTNDPNQTPMLELPFGSPLYHAYVPSSFHHSLQYFTWASTVLNAIEFVKNNIVSGTFFIISDSLSLSSVVLLCYLSNLQSFSNFIHHSPTLFLLKSSISIFIGSYVILEFHIRRE